MSGYVTYSPGDVSLSTIEFFMVATWSTVRIRGGCTFNKMVVNKMVTKIEAIMVEYKMVAKTGFTMAKYNMEVEQA